MWFSFKHLAFNVADIMKEEKKTTEKNHNTLAVNLFAMGLWHEIYRREGIQHTLNSISNCRRTRILIFFSLYVQSAIACVNVKKCRWNEAIHTTMSNVMHFFCFFFVFAHICLLNVFIPSNNSTIQCAFTGYISRIQIVMGAKDFYKFDIWMSEQKKREIITI